MGIRKKLLDWCRKPRERVSESAIPLLLPNFAMSSRFFLYVGFGLIFLALVYLPVKVWIIVQPETPEVELWHLGPIYALLVGVWSLPCLLLGIIESSISKKVASLRLAPILCLANIFLILTIVNQIRFWRGMELQMLLNYSPFLAPCAIVNMIGLLYFANSGKLAKALKNPIIRVLLIIMFAAIPFSITWEILYSWHRWGFPH